MIAGQLDLLAEPGVTTVRCTCGRPATRALVWATNLLTDAYAGPRAREEYRAEHGHYPALVGEGLPVCGGCEPYYRGGWEHTAAVHTTEVTP
ncbi:hypothetical protein ACFRCG_41655 [Embleya sp. NPDC056575]|uniref:hypothetical protein n=1 Tax=unclassified Embleya TaxID=2699296 RepID=UPI00369B5FC0